MNVDLCVADKRHADSVARCLPFSRSEELRQASGMEPSDAVRYLIESSVHTWTWIIDEEVAFITGVVAPSFVSEIGMVWAITTPMVQGHMMTFMRRICPSIVAKMRKIYPVLEGIVEQDFHSSIKWIRSLGFRVVLDKENPVRLQDNIEYYRIILGEK